MYNHSEFGLWGEAVAAKFLKKKGYRILAKNFETRFGELDVVALQSKKCALREAKCLEKFGENPAQKRFEAKTDTLVFVEVKTRAKTSAERVAPQEAVGRAKQQKYVALADVYVKQHAKFDGVPMRFDIVEVVGDAKEFEINHIENAF